MSYRNVRVTNLEGGLKPAPGGVNGALTVTDGAVVPTEALQPRTSAVLYSIEDADVRVKFDGSAPTTGAGVLFKNGSTGTMARELWQAAKFIAATGTAKINFAELCT